MATPADVKQQKKINQKSNQPSIWQRVLDRVLQYFIIYIVRHVRKTMVKRQKFAPTGNMIIDLMGRNSAKKNFPPGVKVSELLLTRPWLNTK